MIFERDCVSPIIAFYASLYDCILVSTTGSENVGL